MTTQTIQPHSSMVEEIYRQHGPELLNYFRRRCPDAATASDLLQETFLQVVRQSDQLASVHAPRAWLFGIARNILARHWRDHQRPPSPLMASEDDSSPEKEDIRLVAVRAAIATLTPELRETLELRLEQELSYEEIAGILQIPVGTVRSRLHTAVRLLREKVTPTKSYDYEQ